LILPCLNLVYLVAVADQLSLNAESKLQEKPGNPEWREHFNLQQKDQTMNTVRATSSISALIALTLQLTPLPTLAAIIQPEASASFLVDWSATMFRGVSITWDPNSQRDNLHAAIQNNDSGYVSQDSNPTNWSGDVVTQVATFSNASAVTTPTELTATSHTLSSTAENQPYYDYTNSWVQRYGQFTANTGGTLFVDVPYSLNAATSGNYNNAPDDYAIIAASAYLNSYLDNLTDSYAGVSAYIDLYNQDSTKTKTGILHLAVDFVAGATGSFSLDGSSNVSAEGINPPAAVPLPPAVYLFSSALLGFGHIARRGKQA